jgi:head-tail adaptor
MANIGGKTIGTIQASAVGKNAIGEPVKEWRDVSRLIGWLDLQSGDSKYSTNKAKLEESTHVFLCDYHSGIYALTIPDEKTKTVPDCRMIIKGMVYDVLLIDNPMEMDEQLEIYLRKVGAWDGK